jgi:tetraacyldisaccharide 4'-kinase
VKWLAPLGALYGALGAVRVGAYRSGLLRRRRLAGPVVSVGNLSVGGSGKTPVVARIAELLIEAGLPVAILSRGYGGSFKGEALIVSDGRTLLADAQAAGDEPVMLARALPAAVVAVGPHRDVVGRTVEMLLGPRVHVLDDGFQHLRLARDLDILCLEAADLHDWPLPAGRLREFASAQRRADLRLVVGGTMKNGHSFGLRRRHLGFFGLDARPQPAPRRPWLVSGIARPQRFHADVAAEVGEIAGLDSFTDHHRFAAAEWRLVEEKARAAGADALVTTAKDAVRLPPASGTLPVLVFRIAAEIEGEAHFRERLLSVARRDA